MSFVKISERLKLEARTSESGNVVFSSVRKSDKGTGFGGISIPVEDIENFALMALAVSDHVAEKNKYPDAGILSIEDFYEYHQRRKALAEYLNIPLRSVEYDWDVQYDEYTVGGDNYEVLTRDSAIENERECVVTSGGDVVESIEENEIGCYDRLGTSEYFFREL